MLFTEAGLELTVDNGSGRAATVSASADLIVLDATGARGPVASLSPAQASIAAEAAGPVRAAAVLNQSRLWGPPGLVG